MEDEESYGEKKKGGLFGLYKKGVTSIMRTVTQNENYEFGDYTNTAVRIVTGVDDWNLSDVKPSKVLSNLTPSNDEEEDKEDIGFETELENSGISFFLYLDNSCRKSTKICT
jgi:hypothetical protein